MSTNVSVGGWDGVGLTNHTYGNATLIANNDLCTVDTCSLDLADVKYIPNLAGNVIYTALFGAVLLAQLGLGIRYKTWGFMVASFFGLILEVIGYIGRIMMHNNDFDNNAFLIYLICLTIAPAFLTAALYLCLGRIVVIYGEGISRLKPGTYTLVFCSCDLLSLVLQAIGGAMAATGSTGSDESQIHTGINIMVAGLAFQVFSLLLFMVLCAEYAWRNHREKSHRNPEYANLYNSKYFKFFLWCLALATITIFIRCVYRVAELQEGFSGSLANNEVTFMIFEGAMVSIAVIAMTVGHPGIAFKGYFGEANFKMVRRGGDRTKSRTGSGSSLEMS